MLIRLTCLYLALAFLGPARAQDADSAWAALVRGGHVALMRHALAPGPPGDPPNYRLDDCATQRNLSEDGIAQAKAVGEALRQRGVRIGRTVASPWCRAKDTATHMGYAAVESSRMLGNLYGSPERKAEQIGGFRDLVRSWHGPDTLLLVSHGSTIQAFTRVSPLQGEIVVLKPLAGSDAGFAVVGRIAP
jgi:phosphohistidine phosphatase SixA